MTNFQQRAGSAPVSIVIIIRIVWVAFTERKFTHLCGNNGRWALLNNVSDLSQLAPNR